MINSLGLVAAFSAFVGIWFGHVAVRKVEYLSRSIWLPGFLFAAVGAAMEILSLLAASRELSLALGILGTTFLWDALEVYRQQQRVRKGHAPANPRNPRHAKILATCPAAITLDLLRRDPVGRPVQHGEAIQMVENRS